jgi:hypothetical protein
LGLEKIYQTHLYAACKEADLPYWYHDPDLPQSRLSPVVILLACFDNVVDESIGYEIQETDNKRNKGSKGGNDGKRENEEDNDDCVFDNFSRQIRGVCRISLNLYLPSWN